MSEDLTVSTAEDYISAATKKVKLPSGKVFMIKTMNSRAVTWILNKIPEDGFSSEQELNKFVNNNLDDVTNIVVSPNIVKPKIPEEYLKIPDVVFMFFELIMLTGITPEGEAELDAFRDVQDGEPT